MDRLCERLPASTRDSTQLKDTQAVAARLDATMEQRVRELTMQLNAANRELEGFAYSVSHDLRAPLRSIDGFSLALAEDCGDMLNDLGKDHLKRVRDAAKRMGELMDGISRLANASRAPMNIAAVDIGPIARAVVQELREGAPERAIEWVIPERLMVVGDLRLMATVVRNLLDNAWKFTGGRSAARIEMAVSIAPPPVPPTSNGLGFMVRDNGVGFDMAGADRLFTPFQRLHSASAFQGTGIGLAIVRRIVNRHGGQTWAEGKPDGGATFHVWIPNGGEDGFKGIADGSEPSASPSA